MSTLLRSTGVRVLLAMGLALSLGTPSVADPLPPVYHPGRLQTIQPSITVVGTIITTPAHQQDGDVTFEVHAGSQTYHAEIVCVFPPTFAAARAACAGYTNRIPIPHRGNRVRITGPLVRDLRHDEQFHELEIHPVTALTLAPGTGP